MRVDLTVFQDRAQVFLLKQVVHGLMEAGVEAVFQLLDLHSVNVALCRVVLKHAHAVAQALRHLKQQGGHIADGAVRIDVIDAQFLDRIPGVVQHIVNGTGQAEQVLPVNGRDKRVVDLGNQVAPFAVPEHLQLLDLVPAGLVRVCAGRWWSG